MLNRNVPLSGKSRSPAGRRGADPPVAPRAPAGSRRILHFSIIGAICTVAFAVAYALLRRLMGPMEANLLALSLTISLNFLANRRYTFGAADGALRQQVLGYAAVYVLGAGASSAVLLVALRLVASPPPALETALALGASFAATVVRFVLLSAWVFRSPAAHLPDSVPGVDAG